MKTAKILTSIVLVMTMLILPAAADEFVASAERNDGPQLEENENGIIITCLEDLEDEDVPQPIEDSLLAAEAEVDERGLTGIYPDFEELWTTGTGGAPVENAYVAHIFDVRYTDEVIDGLTEGKPAAFSFTDECIEIGDIFTILYKPFGSDEWKVAEYTIDINDENVITITVDSTGVFVLVADNGAAPVIDADAPQSPQTGIIDYTLYAVCAAAACVVLACVCFGKGLRAGRKNA